MEIKLNTIEDAVEALKKGKFIIVVDDEDRENEGDFVCAAEFVTPEMVNFMLTEGRGVMCVPLTDDRCQELNLDMQISENMNTSLHSTPFTITVDLKEHDCSTGVSAHDRAATINALANPDAKAIDFARPGHINPLRARSGGVLQRCGHTEATVDMMKIAGLQPVGALIEIMNADGTMARMPQLLEISKKLDLPIISIKDIIAYRVNKESLINFEEEVFLPTKWGSFQLKSFTEKNTGIIHIALVKGTWEKDEPVMVRVHSSCATGDIFGSCKCDCGEQLHQAMKMVDEAGKGIVLYMDQEGRGIGLINKLKAYKLQEQGKDTVEANVLLGFKPDERDYGIGAQILRHLNANKIELITNNPVKRIGLESYGIEITKTVPIIIHSNNYNEKYLKTKQDKMGHQLKM
ncbi:riboflavin biosynthesis protein RibBA [Bacteroidia bacterium]|nr:riboflavin biosynthesis protein RibBA [Bacteroidia bacterium]